MVSTFTAKNLKLVSMLKAKSLHFKVNQKELIVCEQHLIPNI